jgi:predicted peptidase
MKSALSRKETVRIVSAIILGGLCLTGAARNQAKIEYKLVVEGFEWGPSISRVILCFPKPVASAPLANDTFIVKAGRTPRTITGVYLSDETGNRISAPDSNFVTIELKTGFGKGGPIENSSPFRYDLKILRNVWVPLDIYTIKTAKGKTVSTGGELQSVDIPKDNYAGKVALEISDITKSSFTSNGIKINTSAYEPAAFKKDAGKNPLVIWLHGAGGGNASDHDIVLFDNDVTEITKERIQRYFKTGGLEGAYVLYPQCATWWMDNGKGQMTAMGPVSKYTEALKATIDNYLAVNDDVDRSRVYIGGCSNGGYMTVNMILHYPLFFAAGFPVAESFRDVEINDDSLQSLSKEALWFVVSADDTTADPVSDYTLSTYVRLLQAGSKNVHLSYFENVLGEDEPGFRYDGHYSWIYVLQDRVFHDQDASSVRAGGIAALTVPGKVPVTLNGKNVSLWGWLAAQKK